MFRPGAIVGAGMLTIVDEMKIDTPQRNKTSPLCGNPKELKEALVVTTDHKRVLEIIFDVISGHEKQMFLGRRSGPAYFSDKAANNILSAADVHRLRNDKPGTKLDDENAEFIPSLVDEFLKNKTLPVMVTAGSTEQRRNLAEELNRMFEPTEEVYFEAVLPQREAFFIAEKIFEYNKPPLTGGFQRELDVDITSFLVVSVGKSTIHWIVYDDFKHFVNMAKNASVFPGAHRYMYMNYDPLNEDHRIQIALYTERALIAWKAMRGV